MIRSHVGYLVRCFCADPTVHVLILALAFDRYAWLLRDLVGWSIAFFTP